MSESSTGKENNDITFRVAIIPCDVVYSMKGI